MSHNVMHEITPLMPSDCFTVFSRIKRTFDFPLHYHKEYELNLIVNASGAKRIVGSHMDVITDLELVLVGPDLYHAWMNHQCQSESITEITIQFHEDLFEQRFLNRTPLSFIKRMFERSQRGILFSRETIECLQDRIISLNQKSGFHSVLELMSILHDLSISDNTKILSEPFFTTETIDYHSRRLDKVFEYINANYNQDVTLGAAAKIANMPEISFCRFIKRRTSKTFIDNLNEIRLGHASRMLIDTTYTIAEIAYKCGFKNVSNFNRQFKRKKLCVPKEFRAAYTGNRVFI